MDSASERRNMLQRKLTDLEVVEDQITNQVAGLITQMVRLKNDMRDIRQLMASGASNNADAPDVAMPDVAPLEGSGIGNVSLKEESVAAEKELTKEVATLNRYLLGALNGPDVMTAYVVDENSFMDNSAFSSVQYRQKESEKGEESVVHEEFQQPTKSVRGKELVCDICGYLAKYPVYLERHRRTHFRNGVLKQVEVSPEGEDEDGSYSNKDEDDGGEEVRTKTKPKPQSENEEDDHGNRFYRCPECGKGFDKSADMRRHEYAKHRKPEIRQQKAEAAKRAGTSATSSPPGESSRPSSQKQTPVQTPSQAVFPKLSLPPPPTQPQMSVQWLISSPPTNFVTITPGHSSPPTLAPTNVASDAAATSPAPATGTNDPNASPKLYFCTKCNYSSKFQSNVVAHMKARHIFSKCEVCGFETEDTLAFMAHRRTHANA